MKCHQQSNQLLHVTGFGNCMVTWKVYINVYEHILGMQFNEKRKYHDRALSYETFQSGDRVYVYFPIRNREGSPKFTSYWRGPYRVLEKLTCVLYKVDCGRAGATRVIHSDRMRKVRSRLLLGETDIPKDGVAESVLPENVDQRFESKFQSSASESSDQEVIFTRTGRRKIKPTWHND
ncbi:hypothetical protein DPMN_074551 [Dreissena polymorpha]|uniref:Integrase p58-like C-terminal domain-containing protein n=1 Tax=Dreissena polymorpha TaxID=45954 RepID=A0A9D3YIV4_DREPO|nr:hypothetical protein DPMN_074551 [Dreissena polymorpha]